MTGEGFFEKVGLEMGTVGLGEFKREGRVGTGR